MLQFSSTTSKHDILFYLMSAWTWYEKVTFIYYVSFFKEGQNIAFTFFEKYICILSNAYNVLLWDHRPSHYNTRNKNKSNFCKTWKMQYVSFYKRLYILCLFNTGSQTLNKNETFARHNPPHHVTLYVMFFIFCFFHKNCDRMW